MNIIFQNIKKSNEKTVIGIALYPDYGSNLVEPRGIEPLSESNLEGTSPGAVCYLHSLIPAGTNTLRNLVAS